MEFNRTKVKELSDKIVELLTESLGEEYTFQINAGRFNGAWTRLNLEVRPKNERGEIVISEAIHRMADKAAVSAGIELTGHFIGTKCQIAGKVYTVSDYMPRRRKNNIQLTRQDGRIAHTNFEYLSSMAKILQLPSASEFKVWFTVDPDSDAVRESDVEICDRVWEVMEALYPADEYSEFYDLCEKSFNMGNAKSSSSSVYKTLKNSGIAEATKLLRQITK